MSPYPAHIQWSQDILAAVRMSGPGPWSALVDRARRLAEYYLAHSPRDGVALEVLRLIVKRESGWGGSLAILAKALAARAVTPDAQVRPELWRAIRREGDE